MDKWATLSPSGHHRFTLGREWDPDGTRCLFVLLNPSVADAEIDDPTLKKGVKYAKRWGHGSLVFVNLFAWRSTDPKKLRDVADGYGPEAVIGPGNDEAILMEADVADLIVCAWGTGGTLLGRNVEVLKLLGRLDRPLYCLNVSKEQHPVHPLYQKDTLDPKVMARPFIMP
jgi:hypothetical protein